MPIAFPAKEDSECWAASKGMAIVKFDIEPAELDDDNKDYASADINVAIKKIESFVIKNFFENRQAYPDSSYFTHGSFKDHPEMPRPFRIRLGGDFVYQF